MNSTVSMVLSLLTGVALFIFGMGSMSDGLKKVAGNKMEMILYRLTNSPWKGFLLGAAVTCVIQSSSATTVMVVGFVNSGMMKVTQAIGVILGANIGTSITGWIVCMSFLDGAGWASYFSSSTITAVMAVIGMCMHMFGKRDSIKAFGNILLGFAVLMTGMSMMSGSVAPLKENPQFISMMQTLSNPLISLLFGILAAGVLQSSSAAVGVVQSLSVTGALTFESSFPLIMGIGIGASFPVMLAAIGANKDGVRTALVYLLASIISAVLGCALFYPLEMTHVFSFNRMIMDPFSIAAVNTIFRAVTMTLMLPFTKAIKKLTFVLVPSKPEEEEDLDDFDKLESRLLANPDLAYSAAMDVMDGMGRKARKAVIRSVNLINDFSNEGYRKICDLEQSLNKYEEKLGKYLVKLTAAGVTYRESQNISKSLQAIADFEAIGDYSLTIADQTKAMKEKKEKFSLEALDELNVIAAAAEEAVTVTVNSFMNNDTTEIKRVFALSQLVSLSASQIKKRHMARLKAGTCSMELGFVQADIISCYQRIVDHCAAIALDIVKEAEKDFSIHRYLRQYTTEMQPDYAKMLQHYETKYSI
ncbi:Na/Pi cotransporter family protein [Allobaculum sp. JKK-2023]|uniref:Na/Pi cotransporter family protein n=1 Tax=Allobaculum sp. JKK-2023 TaxID=3108943 RepID=UPI002B058F1C|nr:Na/Pi cotransporter family protein [Allobaculum sp. JKK-2023]